MRRVSESAPNQGVDAGGEHEVTAAAGTSSPRMQSAAAFYREVAARRFDDANRPVNAAELARVLGNARLGEMIARVSDTKVRSVAHSPSETVTPEAVYRAWAGLLVDDLERQPNKPTNLDKAFGDALEWGRDLLLELRDKRAFVFRGKLQSSIDVISKVGTWEPELLLARELAKRPELGGSDILTDALARGYFPADLVTVIQAQLTSMTPVASTVPPPPAAVVAARLDDTGVVDALLRADQNYVNALTALRTASGQKRTIPTSNLNLRDQVASPMVLTEIFGRLGTQLNTADISPTGRQILLMTARLAASDQVSTIAKKAAFLGLDIALNRQHTEALSKGQPAIVPPYKSLAQLLIAAKAKLSTEYTDLNNSRRDAREVAQAKVLRDAVDDLIGEVFRHSDDLQFAVESITSASDPGSILLRTVVDTATRERIVNAAMSAPTVSTGRIALLADKARREAELRKRASTDDSFRPGPENGALLLSWPNGLRRPSFEAAASAARVEELKNLGQGHNLQALIEGFKPAKEIFDELLGLSIKTRFNVGSDDQSINDTVRKIIAGELSVVGGMVRKHDHTELLLKSTAISALEMQLQHGLTKQDAIRNIARAIYTSNGQLLNVLPRLLKSGKVTLDMVLGAERDGQQELGALNFVHQVKDDAGATREVPTVNPGPPEKGGNVVFAYRVLALCKDTLGTSVDAQIDLACQNLLRRTGVVSLAPYAGLKLDENLGILIKDFPEGLKPDSPHYIPLLDSLELPPTHLQSIAARPDLAMFPADVLYEIFARCLEKSVLSTEQVAKFAIAGITSRAELTGELCGTNIWTTFNELASRGFDESVGKQILDGLVTRLTSAKTALDADVAKRAVDTDYASKNLPHKAMPRLDAIYRAAAMCAADGKLFKPDDVAAAVLALEPAQGQGLLKELALRATQFFDALSDDMRVRVMVGALASMNGLTDASVLDDARPCFKRLAELKARGVKIEGDVPKVLDGMVESALMRTAMNPLEVAGLRGLLQDARDSGVDVDAVANRLLRDPSKAKAAAGMQPNQLLAVRFETARLVPGSDASLLKAALTGAKYAPGPFVAAFDLLADRSLPDDLAKSLSRSAIDWAADEKAFASVGDFRKRLADTGLTDRLGVFDDAFADAMKDRPKVWEAVPEARALAASTKLKELSAEIMELAEGGQNADARATALADRIASVGPYATELVPQVLSCLRRAVRAQRPTLDDLQVGLDVPQTSGTVVPKAKTPAAKTVDFNGLPLQIYQGEHGHARVPGWANFTATPATMRNMKNFNEALSSPHPYVIVLGPPGPGKTFSAKVWAHITGTPLLELNGGPERRNDEFIGYWGADKRGLPFYERSDFLKVFTKGGLIVDDEFQGSDAHVLDQHAEFASRMNKTLYVRTDKSEPVKRHKQAKIVLIGNFLHRDIPAALRENAQIVYFDQLPLPDQLQIAAGAAPSLPAEDLEKIGNMQMAVENIVTYNDLADKMPLSVRNLKRAARRAERYRDDPAMAAPRASRESFLDGVSDPKAKDLIGKEFETIFGMKPEATIRPGSAIEIRQAHDASVIGEASVMQGTTPRAEPSAIKLLNRGHEIPFIMGDRERHELEMMAKAMEGKESMLYVAPREAGVATIVEAMAQLTGLELITKEVNAETGSNEMFGENTVRAIDDKTFETTWANGFINEATKGPCIVFVRNFHKLSEAAQISTHRMLEERKVPGPNGTHVDMHPDAHIILSAEPGGVIGGAALNRVTIRTLQAKSQAEVLERLVGIAQGLGIPKEMAEQMCRFDDIWSKMLGGTICDWMARHNLPLGGMSTLVAWLSEVADVISGRNTDVPGEGLNEKVRNAFVHCGLKYYTVPGSRKYDANRQLLMSDDERCQRVLEALFDGKDDEVQKVSGVVQ